LRFEIAHAPTPVTVAGVVALGQGVHSYFRSWVSRWTKSACGICLLIGAIAHYAPLRAQPAATPAEIKTKIEDLKDSTIVRAALTDLSKKISDAGTVSVPRIHVLGATYGDLRTGAPKWRTCDSTTAMISSCERTRGCNIPTPGNLCGFDPAAAASDAIEGVAVTYQCVSGDDFLWATLGGKPPKPARGFDIYTGQFKKETQSIACLQVER